MHVPALAAALSALASIARAVPLYDSAEDGLSASTISIHAIPIVTAQPEIVETACELASVPYIMMIAADMATDTASAINEHVIPPVIQDQGLVETSNPMAARYAHDGGPSPGVHTKTTSTISSSLPVMTPVATVDVGGKYPFLDTTTANETWNVIDTCGSFLAVYGVESGRAMDKNDAASPLDPYSPEDRHRVAWVYEACLRIESQAMEDAKYPPPSPSLSKSTPALTRKEDILVMESFACALTANMSSALGSVWQKAPATASAEKEARSAVLQGYSSAVSECEEDLRHLAPRATAVNDLPPRTEIAATPTPVVHEERETPTGTSESTVTPTHFFGLPTPIPLPPFTRRPSSSSSTSSRTTSTTVAPSGVYSLYSLLPTWPANKAE